MEKSYTENTPKCGEVYSSRDHSLKLETPNEEITLHMPY